jgi:hypothetical protein
VQERTNLTQDEVLALEEAGFLLSKKLKCHPKNLFGDDAFLFTNKLADTDN